MMALFNPRTRSLGDKHGKHVGTALFKETFCLLFYTYTHSRWSIFLWVTCTVFKWFRHNLSLHITFQKLFKGCAIIQMFMALQYEQYDECPEDFSLFEMKEYSRSSACQSWKCVRHFIFHYTCFLIQIPLPFI